MPPLISASHGFKCENCYHLSQWWEGPSFKRPENLDHYHKVDGWIHYAGMNIIHSIVHWQFLFWIMHPTTSLGAFSKREWILFFILIRIFPNINDCIYFFNVRFLLFWRERKKNEDFGQSLSLLSAMQCGKPAILVSSINFQMLNVLTQNIMIMAKREKRGVPP